MIDPSLLIFMVLKVIVTPYWNVNISFPPEILQGYTVIVTPYWNVNEFKELNISVSIS